ncbi:hypothetical protein DENSPDRAFT_841465 [Dentipellis sp. KUC8613]|nr:hypothetical protein DENSPDRAFT_841465 [Dentipellis sp. KUC8613]
MVLALLLLLTMLLLLSRLLDELAVPYWRTWRAVLSNRGLLICVCSRPSQWCVGLVVSTSCHAELSLALFIGEDTVS